MSDKIKAMLELEKRGKLPAQYVPILAEARKRGLIPAIDTRQPIEKGWGQVIKENLLGDDDPTTQNFGEKVGSFLNKAGESATFGLIGDEASAAVESLVPGVDYEERRDHYRQQEALLEREHPVAAMTADIGGALTAPLGALGAIGKGASLLPRMAASGGLTGALSGLYGFLEGEGGADNRLSDAKTSAAWGGGIGAALPIVGTGVQRAGDALTANRAIKALTKRAPTTEQLRDAGREAYQLIDDAGVQIKPESFARARKQIVDVLRSEGLDELPGAGSLTPKSARVMQIGEGMENAMKAEPTAALPFKSLDQFRRHAGTAAADVSNKTDAALGARTVSMLDDYVKGLREADVSAGDFRALQSLLPKARDLWSRMSRSQKIDDAIENAGTYLSGGASGVRNQFARIARNPRLMKGFSAAEQKMITRVAQGTLPEQVLYLASSGLGNLGAIGLGALTGGPLGALAGTAGAFGLRKGAEKLANRNAEIARRVIAAGGLKALPKMDPARRAVIEQIMRQATAAGVQ